MTATVPEKNSVIAKNRDAQSEKRRRKLNPSYILVDYENIQPESLEGIDTASFKIRFFVGDKQPRMPVRLASAFQRLGKAVEYIQIEGSGRNALDMHIAFYIGKLSAAEPGCAFHVISNDNDYIPLIAHLRTLNISCQRWSAIDEIVPATKTVLKRKPVSRVDKYIEFLERQSRARPKKLTTLTNSIKTLFRTEEITEAEVEDLIEKLKQRGKIAVDGGKVAYQL